LGAAPPRDKPPAHGAAPPRDKPTAPAPPQPSSDKTAATYAFSFDTLLDDAKRRAQKPYSPQKSTLPAGLDKLSPEQYRSIHLNPDAGIWRRDPVPFRLELLRAAY